MNGWEQLATAFVLVIARVAMFFATFPLFRGGTVPQLVKVALAVSLSIMWLPELPQPAPGSITSGSPTMVEHVGWVALGIAIVRETIIGGLFGFALGLFFLPTQLAGAYLGQEIGFNMGGLADPTTDSTSNVFGDLLAALATLMFFVADTHLLAIGTIQTSFEHLPLGSGIPFLSGPAVTQSFSEAHRWGMQLAAPLGVGLFLTTAITALLMKVSPQLNLLSIGTPLRLMIGLVIALSFLPDILQMMRALVAHQIDFVQRLGF